MLNNVKTKLTSTATRTRDHVVRYRGRYAAATTAAVVMTVNYQTRVKSWNRFLEEHDLTDEFYQPED